MWLADRPQCVLYQLGWPEAIYIVSALLTQPRQDCSHDNRVALITFFNSELCVVALKRGWERNGAIRLVIASHHIIPLKQYHGTNHPAELLHYYLEWSSTIIVRAERYLIYVQPCDESNKDGS